MNKYLSQFGKMARDSGRGSSSPIRSCLVRLGGRRAHENHRRRAPSDSVHRRPAGLHRPGKRLLPRRQSRCRRRLHPRRRRERASGGLRRRADRPRHRHLGGHQRVREKGADQNRRRRDHRHGRLLVRARRTRRCASSKISRVKKSLTAVPALRATWRSWESRNRSRPKGLKPAEPVSLGGIPEVYTAVRTGQTDAAWSVAPFQLDRVEKGELRVVVKGDEIVSMRDQSARVHFTNNDFAAKNPDAVRGFFRAQQRALDYMFANKEETAKIWIRRAELKFPGIRRARHLGLLQPGGDEFETDPRPANHHRRRHQKQIFERAADAGGAQRLSRPELLAVGTGRSRIKRIGLEERKSRIRGSVCELCVLCG